MSGQTFVIVGASLAGAGAAATLRREGFEGRVVLFGEEAERPYERPALSKDYLRGETGRDSLYVHGPTYYADHEIEFRAGVRVTGLDMQDRDVVFLGGERVHFDRLLLATGSAPRRLRIPGADLPGVLYLRTLSDCDAIREAGMRANRVAVIGGGWIGAEVAASLRQLGRRVAMLSPSSVPLERVLGPEVGTVYRDLHADHGIEMFMNERVTALSGSRAVERVETADGTRVEADVVIVGVGAVPRVELATQAGLEIIDGGVAVNEFLESSMPGIFAAGDVAAAVHPVMGSRLRIEHWDNARRQGPAAARNMLGQATAYARIPFFYSDQYDLHMEYSGHATDWDRVAVRGDITRREFLAFWLKDGRVLAGLNANVEGVNPTIARLVAGGRPVAIARLEDPRVPLEELEAVADAGQGKAPGPGRRLQPGTTPRPSMSRGPEEGKPVVPQRVGPAGAVGPRRMKAFGVGGKQVTVANVGGRQYAFDDTCTHQGCSLAEGVLDGTTVECACHGSRFDVTTGTVLRGPATEPVRSHAVRVEGADLLVEA